MIDYQIPIKLFMALMLGSLIGLEREWHKRIAGIRTNVLVTIGAAAFIMFAARYPHESSPTRMASQIVSGIGFLAAGVILRDGFNVTGLNTAATIWCSAAVGVFCGGGYFFEGAILTFFVILANYSLRHVLNALNLRFLPQMPAEKPYTIEVICKESEEFRLRAILIKLLQDEKVDLRKMMRIPTEGEFVKLSVSLTSHDYKDETHEKIISILSLERGVQSISWVPTEEINPPRGLI